MNPDQADLQRHFEILTDDELLRRYSAGGLTPQAQSIALAEIRSRGLRAKPVELSSPETHRPGEYLGDMTIVARQLTMIEAHTLKSCLEAAGIPAEAGNAQISTLLSEAMGGAVLRVPEALVTQAVEIIGAFEQGKFELGDLSDRRDALEESSVSEAPHDVSGQIEARDSKREKNRLKTYRVYSHPGRRVPIVVKEGFSWGAFAIGPVWFLLNRMWLNFTLVSAFFGGARLYFENREISDEMDSLAVTGVSLLFFVTWFLIGKFANFLLRSDLEDRGYALLATVKARNPTYARHEAERVLQSKRSEEKSKT